MAPRRSPAVAALVAAAVLLAPDARAGIRPYIWTWDTQTVAQGDIELEQWLWVRGHIAEGTGTPPSEERDAAYWIWWGPVIGATSQLELAFPFQVLGNSSFFALESFEVDARYRLFSRNDEGKLQPLLRAAFHQSISSTDGPRLDVNAVLSWGSLNEFHATVDLGTRISLPFLTFRTNAPAPQVQLTYAAGASYPITEWFHAGVEVFGELPGPNVPTPSDLPHHFVGVNASWTFAKGWLTAGTLIGLTHTTPNFMPRLIWAVAL